MNLRADNNTLGAISLFSSTLPCVSHNTLQTMASILQRWKHALRRKPSLPRNFTTKSGPLLPSETLLEEETLPFYSPAHCYSVKLATYTSPSIKSLASSATAHIPQSGYAAIYGCYFTIGCFTVPERLIIPDSTHRFIALKVSTCLRNFPEASHRESKIFEHLSKLDSSHPGQTLNRELYDTFELEGSDGPH